MSAGRNAPGRIHVEGVGEGFGGRSLCLSRLEVPEIPFEVAVTVRINEEDGAAGLVIHSDGGDRHYGFYPSSGSLRFSRFDGPVVYDWQVLMEKRSPHYRPDDWNRLKVRVEEDRILCYCNDQLIFESTDRTYTSGQVGLAKFRHTTATFKEFAIGEEIPSWHPDPETIAAVTRLVENVSPRHTPPPELVESLADHGRPGRIALEQRARTLEAQAEKLRQLAARFTNSRFVKRSARCSKPMRMRLICCTPHCCWRLSTMMSLMSTPIVDARMISPTSSSDLFLKTSARRIG